MVFARAPSAVRIVALLVLLAPIELLGDAHAAEPPLPAEPALRPPSEEVAVRAGIHPGFGRLVLDWQAPIAFERHEGEGRLRLRFARPMRADLEPARERLGEYLAEVRQDEAGRELELRLAPGVSVRIATFQADLVVLDFARAEAAREAGERQVALDPAPADTTAPEKTGMRAGASTRSPAAAAATGTEAGAADLGELSFPWSRPVAAAVFARAGWLWVAFDAPPAAATASLPPLPGEGMSAHLASGEVVASPDATIVRFPLRQPIAFGVARDGNTWRVLAAGHGAAPDPLPGARLDAPPRLRFEAAEGGRLIEVIDPEVGDRIGIWPVRTAGRRQPHGQRLVDLELLPTLQGVAWRARSDRVGARAVEGGIEIDAGEGLLLSEAAGEHEGGFGRAQGEAATRRPGEAAPEAAASADRAASDPPGQELPEGSAGPGAARQAGTGARGNDARSGLPASTGRAGASRLDLHAWSLGFGETLPDRRNALTWRVGSAAAENRVEAELNLARFFLAQAMAAEALAVLRGMPPVDQPGARDLEIAKQGLIGAAQFLMGRLPEAAAALQHPSMDHDPEIALWRAALAAGEADWARAAQELDRSEPTLEHYPAALQLHLGLPAALVALEAGDPDLAFSIVARLRSRQAHPADSARIAFVEGLAHAGTGAIDRAERIWRVLEATPYEEIRVRAGYARATMLLDGGRIGPREALAELLPARALWRGHPLEPAMLDGTARVGLAANDLTGAIGTWWDLLRRHPRSPAAERVEAGLREAFANAMLAEGGMELPPLRALALYRAYPELLPAGSDGDRIRRRLADRLAALDLIEPAALLLGDLMRAGPEGAEKAEAGADLAELWLRALQPEAALSALAQSEVAIELAPAARSRRVLLRARALAALNRPAEALELLAGRADPPAQRLRSDVLRQQGDWPGLIRSIERQLAGRGQPAAVLSADERALVLDLALAHGRLGHDDALRGMRARFGPAMRGDAAEPAFLVATMTGATMTGQASREPKAVLAAARRSIDETRRLLEGNSTLDGGRS